MLVKLCNFADKREETIIFPTETVIGAVNRVNAKMTTT